MNKALRMHPAQTVVVIQTELAGPIGDDHGVAEETLSFDCAPQRPLGGDDLDGPELIHLESFQMHQPGGFVGEGLVGVAVQDLDQKLGHALSAHVIERMGVDRIVAGAGAQQLQEVHA